MLISALDVADLLDLGAPLANRVYVLGHRQASAHLVRMKGAAWYEDDATESSASAQMAEALLCLYHALPLLNVRVDLSGGVEAQRWETLGDGTRVQTTYATPAGVEAMRGVLLDQVTLLVDGSSRVVAGEVRSGYVEALSADGGGLLSVIGGALGDT